MKIINFGVLSSAKIAREEVISAIQKALNCRVMAVASRKSPLSLQAYAKKHKIASVYTSYEGLLQDPGIDAIYNPLPNHMHVDWNILVLKYGKHVLCEKPLGVDVKDLRRLITQSKKYPKLKVIEAFMYKFHPQWSKVLELLKKNTIGEVIHIEAVFSYFNNDAKNIRNNRSYGGGSLYDVGSKGYINVPIPFNPKPKAIIEVILNDAPKKTISFPVCDQYTLQAELFSKAIINKTKVPTSLDDSLDNMKVIEALHRSINY